MRDPTIPRHLPTDLRGLTWGRFVDYGDRTVLMDARGRTHALEYVSLVQGFWGFGTEGSGKLPRPWKYNPVSGEVLIEGDQVLIGYLEGRPSCPVVFGAGRSFKMEPLGNAHTLPYNHDSADANPNAWRARLRPVDKTTGLPKGEVRVVACNDDRGTIEVYATHEVQLNLAYNSTTRTETGEDLAHDGADVKVRLRLERDPDRITLRVGTTSLYLQGGQVYIADSVTGGYERLLRGTFATQVIAAVQADLAAAGLPTVNLAALNSLLAVELAAGGGTMLTARLQSE